MEKRNLEDALNSMLRTDYIPLSDTTKLNLLADYYIDYFGYLRQILGETDQLIVGRRGTGKTTLLYRALVECMRSWGEKTDSAARPRTLGIYIDLEKCQSLSQGSQGDYLDFEHAFVSEFCDALTAELTRSWPAFSQSPTLFTNLFRSAEAKKASEVRRQVKELAAVLTSGLPRFVELAGPVQTKQTRKTRSGHKASGTLNISKTGPSASLTAAMEDDVETQDDVETARNIIYRLTIADILRLIGQLREAADIPCVLLFVDEFSSLSEDLQARFTTLLKKILGNHVGLYIKLGAITDNYHLGSSIILQRDLFELSLDLDAFVERTGSLGTAMTELETLTEEIVRERLSVYSVGSPSQVFDEVGEAWRELSRSAMGVPRTIGIVLKQAWHRADSAKRTKIRRADIDYGIRYASKAYLNQMMGASRDGLAIPEYVNDIWDGLLTRAIDERGKRKVPASHFMVLTRNESRLRYLNMFFLVHLLTQGRTTKKERFTRSLYSFDYGVCLENNLGWGDEKNVIRQQRFAYDGALSEFDRFFQVRDETEYVCPSCGKVFAESDLMVGGARLTFCPTDKTDLEEIVHQGSDRGFTEEEIKIIGAIRSASRAERLVARQVADDVGCYVQKVAKFGEKLGREEIVALERDAELGRRIYFGPDQSG